MYYLIKKIVTDDAIYDKVAMVLGTLLIGSVIAGIIVLALA